MKFVLKAVMVVIGASVLLQGCAVYGPPPQAYSQPVPVYAQGGYYGPPPVYVQPAPVYVGPPVSFGFNFGYWGGHGHHHW
jgi:hypothetical protein